MANLELLSMLTAHGVDASKPSGRGIPKITQMDIAASISKLDDREYSLLMAKYCLDETCTHKSWAYWFAQLMDEREGSEWNLELGQTEKLATMTLGEYLSGAICRVCKGRKNAMIGTKVIQCENCNGTGERNYSDREVARQLELPNDRHVTRYHWPEIIGWCRHELRVWEATAASKIRP